MKDTLHTLVIYSTGFRWQSVVAGTVMGAFGMRPGGKLPFGLHRANTYHRLFPYEALSYVNDWKEAIFRHKGLSIASCDTMNLLECARMMRKISEFDLIIILHSAAGDTMRELIRMAPALSSRKCTLAVFPGNEYDILNEKISFINSTGADFLCTQIPQKAAGFLYSRCNKTRILAMPHALNHHTYFDRRMSRDIDVGFRGALYHKIVGDMERTRLIKLFEQEGKARWGLNCAIEYKNLPRTQWAFFLNRCKAIVGAESGTYFLDEAGKTVSKVKRMLAQRPQAGMEDVVEVFKQARNFVSGKALSSRHLEPIGTRTCQILLEGDYNGILQAEEHYISVKKDLSDISLAVEKFLDKDYRNRILENAFCHVMENHTYDHRVDELLGHIR